MPILGGLRLSGKAGRTNLGLLAMGTDEVEGIAPEERFAVVRVSQDLGERSSLGLIATHRQAEGGAGESGDRRTYGSAGCSTCWAVEPHTPEPIPRSQVFLRGRGCSNADGPRPGAARSGRLPPRFPPALCGRTCSAGLRSRRPSSPAAGRWPPRGPGHSECRRG